MERKMRRIRQQLTIEDCEHILRNTTSGVLSLCGDDKIPYGVPLSHVFHEGKLYFHSALSGHKLDIIRENSNVCFTVISKDEVHPGTYTTYFRSVIARGTINIVEEIKEKTRILETLGRRCNPDDAMGLSEEIRRGLARCVALEMTIFHLSGKQAIELLSKAPSTKIS